MAAIRVLVVDDNPEIRFLVRAALDARGGFEIVGEAGDGAAAVEQASAVRPDVILLDLEMPAVGGLEALPRLAEAAPDAKVIVLSGFRRGEYEHLVRAGGAVGYVEKGVTARRLVDEIITLAGLVELVDATVAEVRSQLAGEFTSVRAARVLVDETLRQWDCAEALDDVVLLVSEVVTNAVVHGQSDVEVAVRLLPDALRFEVIDASPSAAGVAARPPDGAGEEAESGRGLAIVDAIATRWGVETFDGGKSIWFEVPRLDRPGDVVIQ